MFRYHFLSLEPKDWLFDLLYNRFHSSLCGEHNDRLPQWWMFLDFQILGYPHLLYSTIYFLFKKLKLSTNVIKTKDSINMTFMIFETALKS